MARAASLPKCPPNVWFAEGGLPALHHMAEQIQSHLGDMFERDEVKTVQLYEPTGRESWCRRNDPVLRVTWEVPRSSDDPTPVQIVAALHILSSDELVSATENPDSSPLASLVSALMGGGGLVEVGNWRIVAVAPDEPEWNPDWASPSDILLGKHPMWWTDCNLTYGEVNQLCPAQDEDASEFRHLFKRLSQSQGVTTVIFNEERVRGEVHFGGAARFIKKLKPSERSSTLVLAVHDHSLYTVNQVLSKNFKTTLDRGGALILPHDPHRAMSRSALRVDSEGVKGTRVEAVLRSYRRVPGALDPRTAATVASVLTGTRKPAGTQVPLPVQEKQDPAEASAREKALQEQLDQVRADLKKAREELAAASGAAQRIEELEQRVRELLQRLDEDMLRRTAALAARQVAELQRTDELRVQELDDQANEMAWLRRELSRATKREFTDSPPVDVSFGSWEELFEASAELLPHVVIGPEVLPAAKALTHYQASGSWMSKTWRALDTLNAYAQHYLELGDQPEVSTLFSYLRWPKAESSISATLFRSDESSSVKANNAWFRARIFPVPETVSPDGRAFMGAHIVIGGGSHPAPRMHLLDATKVDGRVYVGYVGEHLPNTLS